MRNELLKVRENILDHLAARMIAEQGYYGPQTLAQKAFGGVDGGASLTSQVKAGSFNVNPIAGWRRIRASCSTRLSALTTA